MNMKMLLELQMRWIYSKHGICVQGDSWFHQLKLHTPLAIQQSQSVSSSYTLHPRG